MSSERHVNLGKLDLNLLVPLDALLRERSVTRAAQSLGLGQPALSAALSRLRRHFGDELLTRVGNSYELTPLASALRRRVGVLLADTERVLSSSGVFEPATSERTFTVLASDYAMAVLGPAVADHLAEHAPAIRLHLERYSRAIVDHPSESLREVDGIVMPHGFLTDLPRIELFTDSWVCLVSAGHPSIGPEVSLDDLAELPWVLAYDSPAAFTPAARQLQMLGVRPHVHLVVESFLALPHYLVGTDRITLVHSRLAPWFTRSGDLRALPCPFDTVPLVEALWWHPRHDGDREHAWLREVFTTAAAQLDERALQI